MITQKKAFDAVAQVRKIQDLKHPHHNHSTPEWILITERQLQKAKELWNKGDPDGALERLAHVAACGVCALEHNVNSR